MSSNRDPPSPAAAKTSCTHEAEARSENGSKRVRLKDRGKDESEWRGKSNTLGNPDTQRLRKLYNPALAILEADAPRNHGKIGLNPTGLKNGYNPYESGRLTKVMAERRRDLRRLGEWLKLCKQAKNKEREE